MFFTRFDISDLPEDRVTAAGEAANRIQNNPFRAEHEHRRAACALRFRETSEHRPHELEPGGGGRQLRQFRVNREREERGELALEDARLVCSFAELGISLPLRGININR